MKFHKELSKIEASFNDPILATTCIPYKKWKKVVKHHQIPWTLIDLEKQCKEIDTVLVKKISWTKPKKSSYCNFLFCIKNTKINNSIDDDESIDSIKERELLTYASVNSQAVYKVCKKLEKSGYPGAMKFLESLRASHRYIFLGSHILTRLQLDTPGIDMDKTCPICFEDISEDRPALVLPCGHYQCCSCVKDMTHIDKIKGTLPNRMAVMSLKFKCPMCRYRIVFPSMNTTNYINTSIHTTWYTFWPCTPTKNQL